MPRKAVSILKNTAEPAVQVTDKLIISKIEGSAIGSLEDDKDIEIAGADKGVL